MSISRSDKRFIILAAILLALMSFGKLQAQILEEVKTEIDSLEIQHPDIVLRQAVLETGWFECTNCSMDHNNVFGFWYSGKYLEFDTWQESVSYYLDWQNRWYNGGDYYEFLEEIGFAEWEDYIPTLKKMW